MATQADTVDTVLAKLVRDVEMAVHALYRGDVRQQTAKAKTEVHKQAARAALAPLVAGAGAGAGRASGVVLTAPAARDELSADDVAAITRCIMAWLPMGAPSAASDGSRCVPAGRELAPTWGDRERARQALKRAGNR